MKQITARISALSPRLQKLTLYTIFLLISVLYLLAFGYGMRSGNTGDLDVSYLAYVVPGIVSITTLTAGFASSSQKILIQREFFTSFDELILSPMHTSSIVFGKSVIGMLKGIIGASIMLLLGKIVEPSISITLPLILIIR